MVALPFCGCKGSYFLRNYQIFIALFLLMSEFLSLIEQFEHRCGISATENAIACSSEM